MNAFSHKTLSVMKNLFVLALAQTLSYRDEIANCHAVHWIVEENQEQMFSLIRYFLVFDYTGEGQVFYSSWRIRSIVFRSGIGSLGVLHWTFDGKNVARQLQNDRFKNALCFVVYGAKAKTALPRVTVGGLATSLPFSLWNTIHLENMRFLCDMF